jgi:photosystem II stability/assembly factor-like uncharacterized protein
MAMNKRLATVGLGAFLLADIVLVALALRPPPVNTLTAGPTGTAVSVVSPTPEPTDEPTDESTPEPTSAPPTTTAPSGPVPVQRMVVGLDARRAWRASAGTCDGGKSLLQVTTDGGRTWDDATSPSKAIARIQPLAGGSGFVYAAGADCALQEWTTKDDGKTWAGPKRIVGGWTRQIAEPTQLTTPAKDAMQPCGDAPVIDLSRTSAEQAEALCADGNVVVTNDGGASWDDSGSAPGAVALTNRLEGEILTTYAARVVAGCAGVQIVKVIQGKPAVPLTCVKTTVPTDAGQIGISAAPAAGWLVVGDETWTAGADLKSWRNA